MHWRKFREYIQIAYPDMESKESYDDSVYITFRKSA